MQLPLCWKALVTTVFEDNLDGVADAKWHREALEDPKPYYDDERVVGQLLDRGVEVAVFLGSGQWNYWGSFDISQYGALLYESDPLETFDALEQDIREALDRLPETTNLAPIFRIDWV